MKRSVLTTVMCALLLAGSVSLAYGMPLSPDSREQLIEEGRLDEVMERVQDARARGYFNSKKMYSPAVQQQALAKSAGTVDTIFLPVILVDFSDNDYQTYPTLYEAPQFDSILFSEGLMPKGSMTEFYLENSYGTFYVTGDVVGWYRMPQTYAYYVDGQNGWGSCPQCVDQMIIDAISAADPDLDFSKYDNDNDGWVDGIKVVHAGPGAESTGGDPDMIWSHRGGIPAQYKDGVYIGDYDIQPHVEPGGSIMSIGVFVHEYGHVLGLPDLYDTDGSSEGVGEWSVMGSGSWNDGGHRPGHFDPWCKKELGFITYTDVTSNSLNVQIPRVTESPVMYRLWTDGVPGSQYFVVENRGNAGFDQALPGHGLVIWHVDESVSGNWNENHPKVAVEQADGDFDLEGFGNPDGGNNRGDGGDCYPGDSDVREFHDLTVPSSRDYFDNQTEVGVFNISDVDSVMTADFEVNFSRPYIVRNSFDFADASGDNNHRADPGETNVELLVDITNYWAEATNLTLSVSTVHPEIVFSDDQSTIGTLGHGQTTTNGADPIVFDVDAAFEPLIVDFVLSYSADGGFSKEETLTVDVGQPQILLVDDDNANPLEYEEYFTRIFDSLRTPHVVWGKDTLSSPPVDTLAEYPVALWFTGGAREDVLTATDVQNLQSVLDAGGRLLLTGQDIAEDLSDDADSVFMRDYLHVRFVPGSPQLIANGVSGDPISDGHFVALGGSGGAANQNSPDILEPTDGAAQTCYTYYGSSDAAGLRVTSGDYRAVFYGFGMESIANGISGFTKREIVLTKTLDWLLDEGPSYVPGDANLDGAVDPLDVQFIVAYVYKQSVPPPGGLNSIDVNGDCSCDPLDVQYMVNYLYTSLGTLVPGCVE